MMNKAEKAKKILSYLGDGLNQWIKADCSTPSKITYTVEGMNETLYTYTEDNITDSYRSIARKVVDAGLNHGNCIEIVSRHNDEIKDKQKFNKDMSLMIREGMAQAEQRRIDKLNDAERLKEISERYRIEVIKYQKIDD